MELRDPLRPSDSPSPSAAPARPSAGATSDEDAEEGAGARGLDTGGVRQAVYEVMTTGAPQPPPPYPVPPAAVSLAESARLRRRGD